MTAGQAVATISEDAALSAPKGGHSMSVIRRAYRGTGAAPKILPKFTTAVRRKHDPPTVIAGRVWHQAEEKVPKSGQLCLFWFWGDWRNLFLGTWDERDNFAVAVGLYYEGSVRITCGHRRDWWWTPVKRRSE
ncbi:MAG: hypothetical protein PHQ43_15950 [Dehalococcoidales bacterium]|nr:hypothetical protein [Dehalococcoidales bacterium]